MKTPSAAGREIGVPTETAQLEPTPRPLGGTPQPYSTRDARRYRRSGFGGVARLIWFGGFAAAARAGPVTEALTHFLSHLLALLGRQ